jgi:hypothetical protein
MKTSVLILLIAAHAYGDCILQEGTGSDFAKIGVTTRTSIGPLPVSVDVQYRNGFVSEIVASGHNCRTTRGVSVGDTVTQVEKAYGRGRKTTLYLEKGTLRSGKPDRVGKLGDYVLEYPGAAFGIEKEKVWAVFIRANLP